MTVPWLIATRIVPTTALVRIERRSIRRLRSAQRQHSIRFFIRKWRPCGGSARWKQEAALIPGTLQFVRPLNIFFDVDGCLVSWNLHIRPYAREVLERLQDRGHHVYMWSGYGARREVADKHDLWPLLAGIMGKPIFQYRQRLHLFTEIEPDFIIDDHHEIVSALGGAVIRPPREPLAQDREMVRIYRRILEFERCHRARYI